jgi:exopolyphosphatase/guanosine-5'-triphosphate,3'-diphosphate pyrophosphatase
VDIGTNTTRVLVADVHDGRLTDVLQQRAFTRIGMAPEIAREKIEEVARVVARQVELAQSAGARHVRVVATAAIRAALNRDEFLAGMPVDVEILDEAEEARLAFLGATETFGAQLQGTVAVVDVGGGSTEIAVGTVDGGVRWSSSFLVGSGVLADRYLRSDPPTADEIAAAAAHANDVLSTRELPDADCAVAVGGSAASLPRLVGEVLEPGAFGQALDVLAQHRCADVAVRYGLDPLRVRLLPAGILILNAACGRLGQPLRIGRGGLREGVVLDMARTL